MVGSKTLQQKLYHKLAVIIDQSIFGNKIAHTFKPASYLKGC